jgi:hypothetical protein
LFPNYFIADYQSASVFFRRARMYSITIGTIEMMILPENAFGPM